METLALRSVPSSLPQAYHVLFSVLPPVCLTWWHLPVFCGWPGLVLATMPVPSVETCLFLLLSPSVTSHRLSCEQPGATRLRGGEHYRAAAFTRRAGDASCAAIFYCRLTGETGGGASGSGALAWAVVSSGLPGRGAVTEDGRR